MTAETALRKLLKSRNLSKYWKKRENHENRENLKIKAVDIRNFYRFFCQINNDQQKNRQMERRSEGLTRM